MPFEAWLSLGVVGVCLGGLFVLRQSPDLVMLAGLVVLMLFGIVDPAEAIAGFGHEAVITIAALYVVAAGIRETGALNGVLDKLLGRTTSLPIAQMGIMGPVSALSAFMNNTPVVALLLQIVPEWCKKRGISASKLMIPLSYAAILGGSCTIIGTSTNLIVNGLLNEQEGMEQLGFFEIGLVGLPIAILGMLFVLVVSKWLLPDRQSASSTFTDPREYTVEMLVDQNSPLRGQTVEEADLRSLPGLYLIEIDRGDEIMAAVGPEVTLMAGDRLVFAGIVESVLDLQKIPGLTVASDQEFRLNAPRGRRKLIEAVISDSFPFLGKTVRDSQFRHQYDASIIAVARNGVRVKKKVGDISLEPGDTVLLEASKSFAKRYQNSRDFYLVSEIQNRSPLDTRLAWVAITILIAMVVVAALGLVPLLTASLVAAGLMVLTRCCTGRMARSSVDLQVLIVIAASLGMGVALQKSGAALELAGLITGAAGTSPMMALAGIYLATMLLTNLITNNAAAILTFPIALATAQDLGLNVLPFIIAVMMGASASFATPIGYQTNLMVYGPGGYRFGDYLKIGLPMHVVLGVATVFLIAEIWPL